MQASFFIRMNGRFQSIPFESILYISSKKNYCEITTVSRKKILTYGSISYVEGKLPENLFCRVHRSYIISLRKIDAFDSNNVYMEEEKLPLSKEGFERVMQRIILISPGYQHKLDDGMADLRPEEYLMKYRKPNPGDNK